MIENYMEQGVVDELLDVTSKIRNNYPELHTHLVKMGDFFNNGNDNEITIYDLEKHLEKLKVYLERQTEAHSIRKFEPVLELV